MERVSRSRVLVAWFMLVLATPFAMAQQPTALTPGTSAVPTTYPPIKFAGQIFDFYDERKIASGTALYYAPDRQNPDQASQAIIVNYYSAKFGDGSVVSAGGLARALEQRVSARGGKSVASFAVPDKSGSGKLTYFGTSYYVYPSDGNGDIWFSKIEEINGRVVSILYKRQIAGGDADTIAKNIIEWLHQNLKAYGSAVGTLAAPPSPSDSK